MRWMDVVTCIWLRMPIPAGLWVGVCPIRLLSHMVKALKMAIDATRQGTFEALIHHLDRGVQYCCDEYVNLLMDYHIRISMIEDYNQADNAIA